MSFSEKSRKKTFADQNRGVRWVLKEKNTKRNTKNDKMSFFCLFLVWRKVKLKKKKTKKDKKDLLSHTAIRWVFFASFKTRYI